MLEKLRPSHVKRVWQVRYARRVEPLAAMIFPPIAGARYPAKRFPTYDEWTIIHDPRLDPNLASPEVLELVLAAANRARDMDVSAVAERSASQRIREEVLCWPGHHYQLLPALVDVTHAERVVEVGTFQGASALALRVGSRQPSVDTFDVVPWREITLTLLVDDDFRDGITQHIGDLADPDVFDIHRDRLLDADLLFVDGPKDGEFEYAFLPRLLALPRTKPQVLVLDDVKVQPMLRLWREWPLAKLDAASFGHWSGTGITILPVGPIHWTAPTAV